MEQNFPKPERRTAGLTVTLIARVTRAMRDRINRALRDGETQAGMVRGAIETELVKRERGRRS